MARGDLSSILLTTRFKRELLNFMFNEPTLSYGIKLGYKINGIGSTIYTPEQTINDFKTPASLSDPTIKIGGFMIEEPFPANAHIVEIQLLYATNVITKTILSGEDIIVFEEEELLYIDNLVVSIGG